MVHMSKQRESITPAEIQIGDNVYWYEMPNPRKKNRTIKFGGTVASITDVTGPTSSTQTWYVKFEAGTGIPNDAGRWTDAGSVWASMHEAGCLPEIFRVAV